MTNEVLNQFGFDLKTAGVDVTALNHDQFAETLLEKVKARYEEKETLFGAQMLRWLERHILLDIVDAQWKDHLLTLDHLKEGIGLRGYAQKDPLVEFKKEAFTLFEDMMDRIDTEAVRFLFLMQPAKPEEQAKQIERRQQQQQKDLQFQAGPAQAEAPKPVRAANESRPQRSVPVRFGQEVQKMPRHGRLIDFCTKRPSYSLNISGVKFKLNITSRSHRSLRAEGL